MANTKFQNIFNELLQKKHIESTKFCLDGVFRMKNSVLHFCNTSGSHCDVNILFKHCPELEEEIMEGTLVHKEGDYYLYSTKTLGLGSFVVYGDWNKMYQKEVQKYKIMNIIKNT